MPSFFTPLFPERTYHIFNRAVGNERLFRQDDNYRFFLDKCKRYVLPVADVLAWCLLPNHFHFLISIKPMDVIAGHFQEKKKGKAFTPEAAPDFVMERFSNGLNSYAKAYNKMYNRKGGLFMDYLRRVEVETDTQLGATVFYIHKNPVHHGLCQTIEQWYWSSYKAYLTDSPTLVKTKEVLGWFGGREGFRQYHRQPVYPKEAAVIE